MKKYAIKNYKGNIVESLSRFQKNHKGMRIVEVKEENKELKIKTEAISHFGIPLRLYANFTTDTFDPNSCPSKKTEYMGHSSHTGPDGKVYTTPTKMERYDIDYSPVKNFDFEKKWSDVILTIENASDSNKLTDAQLTALSNELNNSKLGECIRKTLVWGLWTGYGANDGDRRPVMIPAEKSYEHTYTYYGLAQWKNSEFRELIKELMSNGLMEETVIKIDNVGMEFTPVNVRKEFHSTIEADENYGGPYSFVEWEVFEPVAVKL